MEGILSLNITLSLLFLIYAFNYFLNGYFINFLCFTKWLRYLYLLFKNIYKQSFMQFKKAKCNINTALLALIHSLLFIIIMEKNKKYVFKLIYRIIPLYSILLLYL